MRGGAIDWLNDSLVDEGRWDHLATWQEHSQTIWLTPLYRAMSSLNAATGRFYWPFPRLDRDCRLLVWAISEIACNSSQPLPYDDCLCPWQDSANCFS